MSPRDAGLWAVRVYLEGFEPYLKRPPAEVGMRVSNARELRAIRHEVRRGWAETHGGNWPVHDLRYPASMMRPKVMLPTFDYAPDVIDPSGYLMVSARARYAMALPDAAVQYLPIEIIDGSDLAYEQDYRWLACLPSLAVLDLERSEYDVREPMPGVSAEDVMLKEVRRVIVRDDFDPTTALFRMKRCEATLLATEALARRYERAGCTGVHFYEVEPQLRIGFELKNRLRPQSSVG